MIKNKFNKILAASAILCATSVATQANAAELTNANMESRTVATKGNVVNCPNGLNLRKGPATNTTILKVLSNGTALNILESNSSWYKVEHNGTIGYVYSSYIKITTTTSSNSETAMNATGKVKTNDGDGLNLRKSNSTSSAIVTVIPENGTITITAKNGDWYKVNYNGTTGYVSSKYVVLNSNNSSTGSSSNAETSMSATGKVKTNDGVGLNLRKSNSTSSAIITVIPENGTVTITAKNGDWYKVNYNGATGYVNSKYVILNSNNSSTGSSSNAETSMSATGKVKTNDGVGLNLRKSNSTSSAIVAVIPENGTVTITAKNGDWYKVNYNGTTGYVSSKYIVLNSDTGSTGDVSYTSVGYVANTNYEGLNLRKLPTTSANVITILPEGAVVTITAKNGDWYKVNYNGNIGYVSAKYVVLGEKPSTPSIGENQGTYEKILAAMKAQLGNPYVWGGSGEYITDSSIETLKRRFPNEAASGWYDKIDRKFYNAGYRAFDCSGLMQWGFAQAGISIGRTTYTQVNNGVGVSKSEARPGDLLITNSQGHVGMYIGNDQWIESPSVGNYIRIRTVNWNNIGYVRRVL